MITSRITSKAQTTIPRAVRVALDLKEGNELVYEIQDGCVVISKAKDEHADDAFAASAEWAGEAGLCRPLSRATLSAFQFPEVDRNRKQHRRSGRHRPVPSVQVRDCSGS